nr:myelin-associated neurite-outgrowth inhibitor-like [Lytechinus pictus]
MRANGPGQSAVAYNGPRTVVSATPVVRETPRAAPPSAVPNSYPKQQYPHQVGVAPSPHQSPHHQPSPHHIPHHATTASPVHHQQPYTAPPIATPAPPGVTSAGAAGGYHSPHHIGFAPHVDQPPPYVSTVSPSQMQAPPLLDKGGYHVQGGLGGPSAPPVCNDPPPATNPHYQGNF